VRLFCFFFPFFPFFLLSLCVSVYVIRPALEGIVDFRELTRDANETVATLILPQLWAMSIGPLLNVDQFTRLMTAIKTLSLRVETEHTEHLAELKRLEESNNAGGGGGAANTGTGAVSVGQGAVTDFEID
jgi:hypothetical protein